MSKISELFDSNFLSKLNHISAFAKTIVDDGQSGSRKSKSKGSSVEFSDFREYNPGDDFRRIDWNAYARFDKLFLKLFMEDKEAIVTIILDISKSMDFGNPNKNIISRRLAVILAFSCLLNYDTVRIIAVSENNSYILQHLKGKNSLNKLLKFLENLEYKGILDLFSSIKKVNFTNAKGICILISDFLPPNKFEEALKFLNYKKQKVYVFQTLSQEEISPSITENVRLIDIETSEQKDIVLSSSVLETYYKVYQKFVSFLMETCYKWNSKYMLINSSTDIEHIIKMVVSQNDI